MKILRISHRIILLALAPVWITTILLTLLIIEAGLSEIDETLKTRGGIIVRQLAPASEYGVFSGNREVLQTLIRAVMREDDVKAVMITDAEDKLLALNGSAINVAKHGVTAEQEQILPGDNDSLIFSAPIYQGEVTGGGFDLLDQPKVSSAKPRKLLGVVYLELSTGNNKHFKTMFILVSFLIGSLGSVVATILALHMSRGITRPLMDVLNGVNLMAQGVLTTRIAINSSGELGKLEHGFNLMAQKLQIGRDEILLVNANLEKTVEIRTLQLEEKNQVLVALSRADHLSRAAAEDANKAKSNFLAIANHDLRQPMHALSLYLGVLSDHDLPESAQPILSNVRQCADAMEAMFCELLDISRLDANMITVEIQAFPLEILLNQIQMEFSPQVQAKGLSLHTVCCSAWVRSDLSLLERIVRNLMSNAVRYTSRGKILIGCRRRQGTIRLSVYDTGIGIASDQQIKVFDEFYQVNNPERDRTHGLGLGLSTVKRLAQLLNVPLSLRSSPGRGTVFAIDLPIAEEREVLSIAPVMNPVHPFRHTEQMLIVLIDDERLILNATKTLLEYWRYHVIAATSGKEAIKLLGNVLRAPDMIICDNRLGENVLGHDVIMAIRNEFNQDIPALLITGDTSSDRLSAIEASGIPVLFKPLQAGVLETTLNNLLSKENSSKS